MIAIAENNEPENVDTFNGAVEKAIMPSIAYFNRLLKFHLDLPFSQSAAS